MNIVYMKIGLFELNSGKKMINKSKNTGASGV